MELQRPDLKSDRAYIGGKWCASVSGKSFDVSDPATGLKITSVPDMVEADVVQAVTLAEAAFKSWRALTAKARSHILRTWYDLIMANQEDLARLLTLEMGKPLAEARGEIAYGASFIEWFAEEGKRLYGEVIPSTQADRRFLTIKQPIGVVGAITPWNFPNAMITRKVGPALAAGCTVVLKPAAETPLSALALARLAEEAGVPAGVFNVVTSSDAAAVGKVLTEDARVRKITFTGSTQVGRLLMRQSSDQLKKLSLELGGNAPFIVFDDADLDAAVDGAIASKFRNSGQTCVCANRLYVQEGIYDAFVAAFAERVASLKVGEGLREGVEQGPLISKKAVEKVKAHIEDAVSKGARIVTGGAEHTLGGTFFEPTVLADVTSNAQLAGEETFGPVAPIFKFASEADVIAAANKTEYGLASYFYARDIGRIWRVAEALETGMVGINTGIISSEVVPFGGVKQSGLGREGARQGIEDYVEIKYLSMAGLNV